MPSIVPKPRFYAPYPVPQHPLIGYCFFSAPSIAEQAALLNEHLHSADAGGEVEQSVVELTGLSEEEVQQLLEG